MLGQDGVSSKSLLRSSLSAEIPAQLVTQLSKESGSSSLTIVPTLRGLFLHYKAFSKPLLRASRVPQGGHFYPWRSNVSENCSQYYHCNWIETLKFLLPSLSCRTERAAEEGLTDARSRTLDDLPRCSDTNALQNTLPKRSVPGPRVADLFPECLW